MNPIIKRYNLKPGDRIVVPKSGLGIVQHHAIYLGQNDRGIDLIAENKIGHGVRVITADDFFRDVISITRIERFKGTGHERKLSVQRALAKLGVPYDLINYNCESFAEEVQTGTVKSRQAEVATSLVGFGLVFWLLGTLFNE